MIRALKLQYKLYFMEAFGLFIFMVSACFFGAMLEHPNSDWHHAIPNAFLRLVIMGFAMGSTALFIFLSPSTAPSGSFINPAVTITRYRLNQINFEDTVWYCIFQLLGGLFGVYFMSWLMGNYLTDPEINYMVTVPGKDVSAIIAALVETLIAFVMITAVLFISNNEKLKKSTPFVAAFIVCLDVIVAGPISGFGMNPARTLASAIPAHTYTDIWIYMVCPFVGMLGAAEVFVWYLKRHDKFI